MTGFLSAAAPRTHFDRYLTTVESRALLAAIRKRRGKIARRDGCWIRLGMLTGFRVASLAGLTVGDARAALTDGVLRARKEHAKRGAEYDVPVSSGVRRVLSESLAVARAMGVAMDDPAAPLYASREGGPLSVRSMQHQMQIWRTAAGIALPASPHWLRHTFAKSVMRNTKHRDPQLVVQALLGHRHRKSTEIYTMPDRSDLAEAMEAVCH